MREIRRQSRKEEVSLEEFRKRYRTSENHKTGLKVSDLNITKSANQPKRRRRGDSFAVDRSNEYQETNPPKLEEKDNSQLKSELLAKEARIKELEAMIAKLEAQNGPLEASKS